MRDIFIFVPAYNVSRELGPLLASIPSEVLLRSLSILIIDDCSTDDTLQVASQFATHELRAPIKIESFVSNKGYGSVVQFGLSEALPSQARFVVCLHGDGQYPANKISSFIMRMEMENIDILQGSRHAEARGAIQGHMPLYKIWGGKFLTFIENFCFTNKLTDRHSGFLCYSHRFLEQINLSKLSSSFDIDIELIAVGESCGVTIKEEPIPTCYAGEKSNLNVLSYGLRVLRVAWKRKWGKYD